MTVERVAPVPRQTLTCLLLAQAVVILPLFLYLPLWLALVWVAAVVIRVQVHRGAWRYPSNVAKVLLALVAVGGLLLNYGLSVGVEPMVGLLLCAFMLKLVEARQRRDLLFIIFIGFVAVGGQFLFSQTIFALVYGAISCCALLGAWQACFSTRSLTLGAYVRRSLQLMVQAIPLMILLFLVLPRVGPLWAVPSMDSTGATGFSDSMAPGDIAELSLSSELAFRVSFEGEEPPEAEMYWRGLVLDQFDGRRWTSSATSPMYSGPLFEGEDPTAFWQLEAGGKPYQYEVMLEPHQEHWLFTLETPVELRSQLDTAWTNTYAIKTRWPVDRRTEYRVQSDAAAIRDGAGLPPAMRRRNLALPAQPANPRTRELAESWRQLPGPEVVSRALGVFQNGFAYTLRPPPLGNNSIDEFLFITQRGFCEHFAGSFVYLMRAAGVPARVVLGYQGGERSEVDAYWLVRQSAAHAWAEVWLEKRGWTRIDPTGVVAPDRIELGLRDAVGTDEVYRAGGETLLSAQSWRWLRRVQHHWDAIGYAWHRRVLGYDSEAQSNFFRRWLGGEDPWRVGLAILLAGGTLVGLYGFFIWYSNRPPAATPAVRLLRQAERRLGLPRLSHEAPSQWAERLARERPEQAYAARQVARFYEEAAYADQPAALYKLQQSVAALRHSARRSPRSSG